MNEINDSADEIARIRTLIDDIAFQTNLLALNAGVEAARAGSAGSGFAVVAAEVRSLAQRTTEAAREIGMLTTTSSERVQQGVELVGQTGSSLDEIVAAVDHVTQQISKIAELSEEQSRGLVEINTAMRDLDSNTQRNAGMFEHSSSASQRLLTQGIRLENLVQQFQFSAPDMAPVPTDLEIETQSTRSAA
jgi:methyl-accepting chemotaxis protein